MTPTIDRLKWLMSQLDNLQNGGNIRYEGNGTFQGAYQELQDVIRTYVDHSAEPAPVNLIAMTAGQVEGVVSRVVDIVTASGVTIIDAVATEIHQAESQIVAAAVHAGQDTVAALLPSGAAPATTEPAPAAQ